MIKVLHKGIQASMDIDVAPNKGVVDFAPSSVYLSALIAGRLIYMDANGKMQLGDGDPANGHEPVGFLLTSGLDNFYANMPALASKKLAHTHGACVIVTDQIASGLTFVPGQKLYCGTDGNVGLVTNVSPGAGAKVIGYARSAASGANPNLEIAVIG